MNKLSKFRHVVAANVDRGMVKAGIVGMSLAPMFAMASGGGDDFDPQTVVTKIGTYVGYGILMVGAFILGRWTLKALGVIGGK